MKYAFIQSQQEAFAVTRMCQMLEVSQSAYYDWLKRPESAHSQEDKQFGEQVKRSMSTVVGSMVQDVSARR